MKPDDTRLRHLQVLSLLLEVGSLTRAADILQISQPSISKILRQLRAHFDDPLLVRVGKSMAPTPKALALIQPLRALLVASESLRVSGSAFDPATSDREFTVLATEVGMIRLLGPLMRRLNEAGPHLRLRALPFDSRAFEGRLEAGEADIAIGAFADAADAMQRQHLYADNYVSVARRDHPRAALIREADCFLREKHVLVINSNTGHEAHRTMERLLGSQIEPDHVQVRVPSFLAAAIISSQSDAVSTLPAKLAELVAASLSLVVFACPLVTPPLRIDQLWHPRLQQDAGHKWLRSTIFDLFSSR